MIHLCLFGWRPNGVGCINVSAGVNKLSTIFYQVLMTNECFHEISDSNQVIDETEWTSVDEARIHPVVRSHRC